MLYNFRGRTAAVHVENVRANFFSHLGGHAHPLRLSAKNLHREWSLVLIEAHLPFRFWIVPRQAFDGNEFGNSQPDTAALLHQASKGNIGHARHWRKHQRRIDLDVANLERLDLSHKKAT